MNNLDTHPPAYSTLDAPDCKSKQESECNQTPGCQLYNDECVPKVQETIASLYHGRAGEVQRTLSAVTGRDCAPQFREMYENNLDSIDARANRDRTMAAMLARNIPGGDTDWTDGSRQDVQGFLNNPGCVICSEASDQPFGRMRCCGAPIHEYCFTRWFEGKPRSEQRCLACRVLPDARYRLGADHPLAPVDRNLLLPWRRMDANNTRYVTHPRPPAPPHPVQHADVTINAENGGCPIGRLTGGNLCTVDAELAKKIHVVVHYKDGGVTSSKGQEIYDLVHPIFGPFRVDSGVDLNMDIPDDRVVEREARANKTRATINYVFTNVFPNIQFQDGLGGLTARASLRTVLPVSLGVFNGKLRTTLLEELTLTSDGGIQGNDGDVEEMCRILDTTPLLNMRVANFNISIEAGLTLLEQQDSGWSRSGRHGGVYKLQEYIRTYLRVDRVDGVNTLVFKRIDTRPRGLGAPDGWWARYWASVED